MKFAIGLVVFAAMLGAAKLWTSGLEIGKVPAEVLVGAGLCAIVVACLVGVQLRNRRRKQELSSRDSALW